MPRRENTCTNSEPYRYNKSLDLTKKALELPSSTEAPQPNTFNLHMLCSSIPKALDLVFGSSPPGSLAGEVPTTAHEQLD